MIHHGHNTYLPAKPLKMLPCAHQGNLIYPEGARTSWESAEILTNDNSRDSKMPSCKEDCANALKVRLLAVFGTSEEPYYTNKSRTYSGDNLRLRAWTCGRIGETSHIEATSDSWEFDDEMPLLICPERSVQEQAEMPELEQSACSQEYVLWAKIHTLLDNYVFICRIRRSWEIISLLTCSNRLELRYIEYLDVHNYRW